MAASITLNYEHNFFQSTKHRFAYNAYMHRESKKGRHDTLVHIFAKY